MCYAVFALVSHSRCNVRWFKRASPKNPRCRLGDSLSDWVSTARSLWRDRCQCIDKSTLFSRSLTIFLLFWLKLLSKDFYSKIWVFACGRSKNLNSFEWHSTFTIHRLVEVRGLPSSVGSWIPFMCWLPMLKFSYLNKNSFFCHF